MRDVKGVAKGKRGVIFAGGVAPGTAFIEALIRADDYIICLDSGLEAADKANIAPSVIVGDFDSVTRETLEKYTSLGISVNQFSTKKDFTDMELGIQEAIKADVDELILLGALGGRADHMMGNIDNMVQALNVGISTAIFDEKQHIYMLNRGRTFYYKKGSVVSLIPFTSTVDGIVTTNLIYPLYNESLAKGYSRGISNIFAHDMAAVDFKSGILQVVVNIS